MLQSADGQQADRQGPDKQGPDAQHAGNTDLFEPDLNTIGRHKVGEGKAPKRCDRYWVKSLVHGKGGQPGNTAGKTKKTNLDMVEANHEHIGNAGGKPGKPGNM